MDTERKCIVHVLASFAGRIGATFVNGSFVRMASGDVAFCRKVGVDGSSRWVPSPLPTMFRSQLDVRSTADALGARVIGGVVSANVIADHHAVAWKEGREWTLEQIVNGEASQGLSLADYDGIFTFYNS